VAVRGLEAVFLTSNPSFSHSLRKAAPSFRSDLLYIFLFLMWSCVPYAKHQQGRGKVNDKQKRTIRWNEVKIERDGKYIFLKKVCNWSGVRMENRVYRIIRWAYMRNADTQPKGKSHLLMHKAQNPFLKIRLKLFASFLVPTYFNIWSSRHVEDTIDKTDDGSYH
jgi:hypothetical protein